MKNLRNRNAPPDSNLIQVYLRSSWDIVTDIYKALPLLTALAEAIEAGELDSFLEATDIDTIAKLNAILTDATLGDFASQAEAEAGTSNVKTMTPLRVAQAIAIFAAGLLNKVDGTVAPGASDDDVAGYSVGSYWIDIVASPNESYRCTDNSTGAAVWIKTTLTADELATVALTGDSDDLTEGVVQLLLTVSERSVIAAVDQVFTAAEKVHLGNIEVAATADQTDGEIETGYNNQVDQVSAGEKTAGTEAAVRRFSPLDVADMAGTHGGGGGIPEAPVDGNQYARKDAAWEQVAASGSLGQWIVEDGVITLAVGDRIVCNDFVGSDKVWTLPAVFTAVADPNWIWIWNASNKPNRNIILTPASGDELYVAGQAIGTDVTISLANGEMGFIRARQDNVAWDVLVLSTSAGGGGGLTPEFKTASFTAEAGKKYFIQPAAPVVVTLPAGNDLDNILLMPSAHNAGTYNITLNPNGAETIDNDTEFVIDQDEGDVDIAYNDGDSNWEVSSDGQPDIVNVADFIVGRKTKAFWMNPDMRLATGQNPSAEIQLGSSASFVSMIARSFDASTVEFVLFNWVVPDDFDESWGVAFIPIWSPATTNGGDALFELRAKSYGEGEAVDQNATTPSPGILSLDTALGTVDDIQYGPESNNCGGNLLLVKGELVGFRYQRFSSDGTDTFTGDANIIGIRLIWKTDAVNEDL